MSEKPQETTYWPVNPFCTCGLSASEVPSDGSCPAHPKPLPLPIWEPIRLEPDMSDEKSERDLMIDRLRIERDAAAQRGDHAESLILNDRILDLKSGSDLAVERVMRQFESALVRRRTYGQPSSH